MSAALTAVGLERWFVMAVMAGWLVAVPAAVVGLVLYFRRMSMLPDALAHVALPGVATAYLVAGGPSTGAIFAGALGSGALASGAIAWLRQRRGIGGDAAIGAIFPLFFAAGVVLTSTVGRRVHLDLNCILFGNLLGVSRPSLFVLAASATGVLAVAALLWRPWIHATFDAQHARASGAQVEWLDRALLAAAATVAVAGFDAVGAVLVVAFFALPALAAHAISNTMRAALIVAIVHALVAVLAGLVLAARLDAPPAGVIVCVGALLTVAAAAGAALVREKST